MKMMARSIAVLLAAVSLSAMPVLAQEQGAGESDQQQMQKDECLLASQHCRDNVDTVQERIQRLDREIGKGNSVYTDQEIRQLQWQRDDMIELMRTLVQGGGA